MEANFMTTGDLIFFYSSKAAAWLNPVIYFCGLCIAVWAFLRCHKWGYAVIACYFGLAFFWLMAGAAIDREIRAHRRSEISAQAQQKIDAAYQKAVHNVLVDEGHPEGIPLERPIHFPFGPMLLVLGLWLIASRETHRSNIPRASTA